MMGSNSDSKADFMGFLQHFYEKILTTISLFDHSNMSTFDKMTASLQTTIHHHMTLLRQKSISFSS
jgi:hypothetical protein